VYIVTTQQAAVGLFPTVRASGVTHREFFAKFMLFLDGVIHLTGTLQRAVLSFYVVPTTTLMLIFWLSNKHYNQWWAEERSASFLLWYTISPFVLWLREFNITAESLPRVYAWVFITIVLILL